MFSVKVGSSDFTCTRTVKLLHSKVLSVSDAECVLVVPLGLSSDSKAVKMLAPLFEKALAAAEDRSSFVSDIEKSSAALEKMLLNFERRPAAERGEKQYEQLVAWVKRENGDISLLWRRWCEIHAPKMASEALQACINATREKAVQELAAAKKAAVGKASKLPTFQIVAGAVSIAAGSVPAAVLGTLKIAAALLEKQRNTQKELQLYSDGQEAVGSDLAAFAKAVDALRARIKRVDDRRSSLELMIIQNTNDARRIKREVETLRSGASGTAVQDIDKLNAALDDTLRSTQALTGQMIDPAPLEASLNVIAAEQAKMAAHLNASASKSGAASNDIVPILKTSKEIGDILNGLASLAGKA
jgi:predicted nuclease with TOPRIM domain